MWRLIFLGLLIWLVLHLLKRNFGQIKPPKNDSGEANTNNGSNNQEHA